jgi:RimJ/RimL family protein N-acetyltransferase
MIASGGTFDVRRSRGSGQEGRMDDGAIATLVLDTERGPVTIRREQTQGREHDQDGDFLYRLFRSHALAAFGPLPVDDAMKESLVRMQFASRTATYRSQYPDALFAILERDGSPFGRVVVDEPPKGSSGGTACIVDLELMAESRGGGIGSALMTSLVLWLGQRCEAVRCTVLAGNEASLRMCRRAGFVPVADNPPHVELEWRRPPR